MPHTVPWEMLRLRRGQHVEVSCGRPRRGTPPGGQRLKPFAYTMKRRSAQIQQQQMMLWSSCCSSEAGKISPQAGAPAHSGPLWHDRPVTERTVVSSLLFETATLIENGWAI